MKRIGTFRDLDVRPKSLVLLDIDETILFYENINERWWKEKVDYHVQLRKCDGPEAITHAAEDWFEHIQAHLPKPTDAVGLDDLLDRIRRTNSELRFITARNPKYKHITELHLSHLGLGGLSGSVCYLGGASKGKYILNNIDTDKYDSIMFIDDLEHNIASVTDAMRDHARLETYQFVMQVSR